MAMSPAVCPLCARVHELNPQAMPEALCCEGCGAALKPRAHGAAVLLEEETVGPPPELPEVKALLERVAKERRPDRKYALIQQALQADPVSFAANRALLYHGRLHEVIKRPGDYSLIKCYLLHIFEEPEAYTAARLDERMQELFFEETYAFLSERYGAQNVISAYVHLDERSPHMHFAFVPV